MRIKRKLFNAVARQVNQRQRPNNAGVTQSQPQKAVPQVQKPIVGMITEQGRMQRQMMANVRQRWAIKSREKLAQCLTSVEQCKAIQNLLHPEGFLTEPIILNEAALFIDIKASYKDKETVLKIKGKLDNFTIDNGDIVLNDLKTTGHYIDQFKESFENYHYYRQIALYGWMLKLYAKAYHNIDKITSFTANMLLVSTIPTYKAGIYKVSKSAVSKGFTELIDLLKRVAALELL